jgi:uncharacterized membrane protein
MWGIAMDETTQGQVLQANSQAQAKGVTLMRPTIVALLYLLNIFLGFSVFVGLVLAYVWRNDETTQEWEKTHFTYLIRTFWIGFAISVAIFFTWTATVFGVALEYAGQSQPPPPGMFVTLFGGVLLFLATAVWFCIRCILSLVKTGDRKPMPNPGTWLF